MNPSEILKQARELERAMPEGALKLALISTFTTEFLRPYLIVSGNASGLGMHPWCGPFGQLEQMVMQNSALWEKNPQAIWIALRIQDVDPSLGVRSDILGAGEVRKRLEAIVGRLLSLAKGVRERSSATLLVSNLELAEVLLARPFEASHGDGLPYLLADANRALALGLADIPDAHVFDWAGVVGAVGCRAFHDPKLWHTAKAPVAPAALPVLAASLVRSLIAVLRPAAKCLVLDLDNTLWGGVLGDDGPEGIKIGGGYPGNVFLEFQEALLGYRDRGFLLAIASKNNPGLVEEALTTHPDMRLRKEHFAKICANWEPKHLSLQAIATDLNVGLDSLVFIDDNPVERAQVREALPQVRVLDLPSDPLGYLEALQNFPFLDRPRVLEDDAKRATMYLENQGRAALQAQTTSLEDYLVQLDMVAEVGLASPATLERIHQLIHKTNQFNLTTRRHKLEEVRRMAQDPGSRVAWLRLADRFGDMGLVCVGILQRVEPEVWEIDTFLMSCRVMGRGVEEAFLAYLAELALGGGGGTLRGLFAATAKNTPVQMFYPTHGFSPAGGSQDGCECYEKPLGKAQFPWPEAITRKQH